MSKTPKGPPDWYRLDNAGVLYSALQREKYSPVYRFSAVLSQPVDPAVLQRAVDRTMPRFPGFRVRMKPGVFWHYFEPNDSPGPFVRPDMSNPCQPIRFREDNGWLVRFFYYQSRISLEVFHAVSDGAGALTFFPHPAGGLPPGAGTPHPLRPRPAGRGMIPLVRRSWRMPTPGTRASGSCGTAGRRPLSPTPARRSPSTP